VFTRVKQSRNGEYLQVVESYRDQGRVRQRSVLYVGPYESLDDALELMPKQLGAWRRKANRAEKDYEAWSRFPDLNSEPERKRADYYRRQADHLETKLAEVRKFVEEHPDVLKRDRERAKRQSKWEHKWIEALSRERREARRRA
jgi:hypothetical protein